MEDIRYKQRFENFEKSFMLLKDAVELKKPNILPRNIYCCNAKHILEVILYLKIHFIFCIRKCKCRTI